MSRTPFARGTAILMLSIVSFGFGFADSDPAEPEPWTLTGRVIDGSDQAVQEAIVWLRARAEGPQGELLTFVADEAGRFVAEELTAESYELRVEAEGFAPVLQSKVTRSSDVAIRLQPGHALSGTVLDESSGKPLPGATVTACDRNVGIFGDEACRKTVTGEDGSFAFRHLSEGMVALRAVADGYEMRFADRVAVPVADVELLLGPGGRVSGSVVDREGNGVDGARVQWIPTERGKDGESAAPHTVRTEADGSFEIDGLRADTPYDVLVTSSEFSTTKEGPLKIDTRGRDDLSFVLSRGATLKFRLIDDEERVVTADLRVRLVPDRPEGAEERKPAWISVADHDKESGDEGDWTMVRLKPGRFRLKLAPDGYATLERAVLLEDGKTLDLGVLIVEDGELITGQVTDTRGAPIEGASAAASWRFEGQYRRRTTTTDGDGLYRIGGLEEGTVARMKVSAPDHTEESRTGVASGETHVDFVLVRTASITGRIETADGSIPSGGRIELHTEAGSRGSGFAGPGRNTVRADDTGSFKLSGVRAGNYTLLAMAPNLAPTRRTGIRVEEGDAIDVGLLVLEEGLVLRGHVTSAADNQRVPNAQIQLFAGGDAARVAYGGSAAYSVHSASDGTFEIGGLEPGSFRVVANHKDYSSARKQITVETGVDPTVELTLTSGGRIAGTVRDAEGRPVSNVDIGLGSATMNLESRSATTNSDGVYVFERLTAGAYIVMRTPQERGSGKLDMRNAAVIDGETTVVDFNEEAKIHVSGSVLRQGEALPEVRLVFLPAASRITPAALSAKMTHSGSDGRYEIGLDLPGAYQIMVQRPGSQGQTSIDVVIPDQQQIALDIRVSSGSIVGSVTGRQGKAVARARVTAQRDGASANLLGGQGLAMTREDGSFAVEGLEPGVYRVTAAAEGYAATERYPVTLADDQSQRIDIELQAGRPVRGQVVDPAGNPLSGVVVYAVPQGAVLGIGSSTAASRSDVNGRFELALSSEGASDLTFIAAGWAPRHLRGVVPSADSDAPMTIVMGLGGSILVRAVGPNGAPAAGITIAPIPAFSQGGEASWIGMVGTAATDAAGVARLQLLAPGEYRLEVPNRENVRPVAVVVEEGRETTAEIQVPSD